MFQRGTGAVAAVLALVGAELPGDGTLKELQAGEGFQLAMGGRGQPEERCPGENEVAKVPHGNIDSATRVFVQIILRPSLLGPPRNERTGGTEAGGAGAGAKVVLHCPILVRRISMEGEELAKQVEFLRGCGLRLAA